MIRCITVDDEHLALALLENYIGRRTDLVLVGAYRSPILAVEALRREEVDLLFLDIQMPILSGVNLLRAISHKPVVIFTTAYTQYAPEAFDLDAADYLLKPFSYERFEQAVKKAAELLHARGAVRQKDRPDGALTVKADRQWRRIPFDSIVLIEGWKEYVKIYTLTEKVITLESLNNLENTLPAGHFLRVHKSFIVAKNHVQRLDGDELILGPHRVPVARARKQAVIRHIFP